MNLPQAPDDYGRTNEQLTREQLQAADAENFKKGADVRLERNERLVLKDEVTGDLYRVYIASGVLSIATFP